MTKWNLASSIETSGMIPDSRNIFDSFVTWKTVINVGVWCKFNRLIVVNDITIKLIIKEKHRISNGHVCTQRAAALKQMNEFRQMHVRIVTVVNVSTCEKQVNIQRRLTENVASLARSQSCQRWTRRYQHQQLLKRYTFHQVWPHKT